MLAQVLMSGLHVQEVLPAELLLSALHIAQSELVGRSISEGVTKKYTFFARSALCTVNPYDLYALAFIPPFQK